MVENPESMLDQIRNKHSQLKWKIKDRRSYGLLGPSFVSGTEEDCTALMSDTDTLVLDRSGALLEQSVAQIGDEIDHLQSHLSNYTPRCSAVTDILPVRRSVSVSFFLELLGCTGLAQPWSCARSDCLPCKCRKIETDIDKLGNEIEEIVRIRSNYRRTYMSAFYARFLPDEEDKSGKVALNLLRGKSNSNQRRIFLPYSLQTLHEQSQTMYLLSKKLVSTLEKLHKLESDKESDVNLSDQLGSLIRDILRKFETSLHLCSKFPHAVIGASRLVDKAALSVQRVSEILDQYPVEPGGEKERELDSWIQDWNNSLESLDALIHSESDKIVRTPMFVLFSPYSCAKLPHQRARIIRDAGDYNDPETFCKSQNISFATIGSRISREYENNVLFSGCPDREGLRIQRGGFGKVYEVKLSPAREFTVEVDTNDPVKTRTFFCDKVAVKKIILTPGLSVERACLRIIRELEARVVLRHESILPLLGLWEDFDDNFPHYPLLVSPWMDDGDLHHYITRNPETTTHQRLVFLRDVASALAYMHEHHGIEFVHGDLKANNVLVHEGRAYLHDFGLSRVAGEDTALRTRSTGNWRWQAPELLDHHARTPAHDVVATPHSDMYSYGSLFLEVLTGRMPWDTYATEEYRVRHPSRIQKRPSGITDDRYWSLMKQCWMEEPTLRLTAQGALQKVQAFLA